MQVSVIMPCYNGAFWIEKALKSIAEQTYPAHEIIVIDDGSTDDSVDRVESSGVEVRLLHSERAGCGGARNVGIESAKGDWVAFLDADDRWYSNHLERAFSLLKGTKDIAYFGTADWLYSQDNDRIVSMKKTWPFAAPTNGLSAEHFLEFTAIAREKILEISSVVAQREAVLASGSFDPDVARYEDLDLMLRLLPNRSWAFDPIASTIYRFDTPASLSRNLVKMSYFRLKALVNNRELYCSPHLDRLLRESSRLAMSKATSDGTTDELEEARKLAGPYLSTRDRLLFKIFTKCPGLFQRLNQARRRIFLA